MFTLVMLHYVSANILNSVNSKFRNNISVGGKTQPADKKKISFKLCNFITFIVFFYQHATAVEFVLIYSFRK